MALGRTLYVYLMQPGVIKVGLIGTLLQLVLGVANNFNIVGLGDVIAHYGLSGHLASGGLVAALTGVFYALTEKSSGHTVVTGAGAAAGGVSGTLGLGLSQTLGITPIAAGATPIIDFTMLGTTIAAFLGMTDPGLATTASAAAPAAFDGTALSQAFTLTAAGGAAGALLGSFVTQVWTHRTTRRSRRPRHAHPA